MAISDYQGIFVFIEQRDKKVQSVSLELLGKANELAKAHNKEVTAVLLGDQIANLADELIAYGADKVMVVEHEFLAEYTTEPYTTALYELASEKKPEIMLFGATSIGRDLAPRLSARLATGLTADCTSLEIEDDNLVMTRPAFGGNIMASILCSDHRPQMSTVRAGVMQKMEKDESRQGEVVNYEVKLEKNNCYVEVLETVKEEKEKVDIAEAQILVSAGRGVANEQGFAQISELAKLLNASISASRSAVDSGFAEHDQQVGQTGKTVRPHLYIACGISGAIQHLAGMEESEMIIAINKDKDAPIFGVADLGVVGNAEQVLPLVIKKVAALQAE